MRNTVILSRSDVASLLTVEECMVAGEYAFGRFGEGKALAPKVLGIHAQKGGLHIKAGMMTVESDYIVAKLHSNFSENPAKRNLPTIQGTIAIFDANTGALLSLMDSIEITIVRTGAATGVASKY